MVFTRKQLLDKVWSFDYFGDARTVDTHIKALREHLGPCRRLIETVWGVDTNLSIKSRKKCRCISMAALLWGIMVVLVTVTFM